MAFVAVLSSPLQRAQQTCALAGLGMSAEIRQTVPKWNIWDQGCPDGEDATDVQARCERIIERALAITSNGDIALFAHGHILRALTGTWLGLGAGSICILGFEKEQQVITRWNTTGASNF